jgi:hypothetical protein
MIGGLAPATYRSMTDFDQVVLVCRPVNSFA